MRKFYPKNVCHVDDGTAKEAYQNGMFAGDWIILKENYIDGIFDSLIKFLKIIADNLSVKILRGHLGIMMSIL